MFTFRGAAIPISTVLGNNHCVRRYQMFRLQVTDGLNLGKDPIS
jgi:hypothetical protein